MNRLIAAVPVAAAVTAVLIPAASANPHPRVVAAKTCTYTKTASSCSLTARVSGPARGYFAVTGKGTYQIHQLTVTGVKSGEGFNVTGTGFVEFPFSTPKGKPVSVISAGSVLTAKLGTRYTVEMVVTS